jgi:hypothetical protein
MYYRIFFFLLALLVVQVSIAQNFVVKSIKDFGARGDGHTSDHKAFEKAAAFFNKRGGHGKLILPKGVYIVGDQQAKNWNSKKDVLSFANCSDFAIEGSHSVVRFRDSLRFGAFVPGTKQPFYSSQSVFTVYNYAALIGNFMVLTNCKGITIKNLEVDGNTKAMILGGKFGDHGYQLPNNGIYVLDCSRILIDNVYIHHMGCDGIQVANKTPQGTATPDQGIVLQNSSFEYNARQGLSWVGGSGLKAVNCKFNFTGKGRFSTAPASGMDIEAEIGVAQCGVFINCEFVDNSACGMVADSGDSRDMKFNNCLFWGTTSWSMWTNKPNYNFTNCRFYGSIVHCFNAPDDSSATKFRYCSFEDKPFQSKPAYGKYLVEINFKRRVIFDHCTFTANKSKMWWFDGDPAWKDEEKPMILNSKIILKMDSYPIGDFISVKSCIREGNSTYEIYYSKNKKYYEAGGKNLNLGNNVLVWENSK